MREMRDSDRGFTLIELLVVIAIVAILAVVVILTLNPSELLKQARDSNRIQDLNTLKTAIAHYLADVSSPSIGTAGQCYVSAATTSVANCGFTGTYTANASTNRSTDGTGWLPIQFSAISSRSPIGSLPLDPVNNGTTYMYRYTSTATSTFKLMATLESNKYGLSTGTTTIAATDGGNATSSYETGTNLAM